MSRRARQWGRGEGRRLSLLNSYDPVWMVVRFSGRPVWGQEPPCPPGKPAAGSSSRESLV